MFDAASSVETVHHWHCDVEEHDIRSVVTDLMDSFRSVRSFADDLNVFLRSKDLAEILNHVVRGVSVKYGARSYERSLIENGAWANQTEG